MPPETGCGNIPTKTKFVVMVYSQVWKELKTFYNHVEALDLAERLAEILPNSIKVVEITCSENVVYIH